MTNPTPYSFLPVMYDSEEENEERYIPGTIFAKRSKYRGTTDFKLNESESHSQSESGSQYLYASAITMAITSSHSQYSAAMVCSNTI